jgi:hypothetical protein
VAQLEALRGEIHMNQAVMEAISWATREDYEIRAGISLSIPDAILDASHEIQYWESTKFLPQSAWHVSYTNGSGSNYGPEAR